MRTQIKKFHQNIKQSSDVEALDKELRLAQKEIDQLAATGVLHRNTASRQKSQLARRLNDAKAKAS